MVDSAVSSSGWILLVHQLPPKPDYVRVKVRRRLQRIGAVALKSTVYVLPNQPDTVEDFEWLRQEIESDGGDATVVAATFISGLDDDGVRALFLEERNAAYGEIVAEARGAADPRSDSVRLRRRLDDVGRIDFFGASGRRAAEEAVDSLEARAAAATAARSSPRTGDRGRGRGQVWVTRQGVFVDRIASAWLVRRFIDPLATFKFVAGRAYRPGPNEVRFDMYQAEYTHEGDRCTFETLIDRFELGENAALHAIAEIVHDIDLKDEKFGRGEATGVATVLAGITRVAADDDARIELGSAIFDGLYTQFGGKP